MHVDIYHNIRDLEAIKPVWNNLVLTQANTVNGLGPMSTFDCVQLLCETHLADNECYFLVAHDGGRPCAILPLYRQTTSFPLLSRRDLAMIPGLYPIRTGLIAEPAKATECMIAFIQYLLKSDLNWDNLFFTAVDDGPSDHALKDAADDLSIKPILVESATSPYMSLPESAAAYLTSMSSKLAKNIRWCTRGLEKINPLTIEIHTTHAQIDDFLRHVLDIEKSSWKEDSGTSLTTNPLQEIFHTKLAAIAADNSWLKSYILKIGERPIAYQFGLLFHNTFYLLKTSYSHELRKYSPGTVLAHQSIEDLCDGGIKVLDFMGTCDPYKMRWTKQTYTNQTYALYSPTLRGRLHQYRSGLASNVRRSLKRNDSSK